MWLQTFIICVGGLLVAIFFHVPFEIGVLFPILLPFSGRAYWFVTDYLFLLIIAPLLKNAIKDMNDVALKRYTFFLFIINSVMCFLFRTFAWDQDYSNIGLFICLFFLCALIKRNIEKISRSGAICILFLSIILMVASYITMKEFGTAGLTVFEGKEEFFYSYNCPIVIIQACSIFIVFLKGKYRTFKGLSTITGASLVVYLIHMHPIFKQQYINYNLLKWMSTKNSLIYVCQVLLLTLLIYLLGILLSFPVLFISRKMTEKICGILKIN